MNDHEAERIAAAVHALRPDWPTASVLTLIRKNLIDQPRRDVIVALGWIAAEPASQTPARVLESGPWWRAAGTDGTTSKREKVDPAHRCSVCSRHADDKIHPDDHAYTAPAAKPPPDVVVAKVAQLRAELTPTAPRPEPLTREDFEAKDPDLHARLEALRANPATALPAMRESEPSEESA